MSIFKKASKQLAKLKIAITGPAGSGKTFSALLLAKGMSGRVAVIDTENNSACLYADKFGDWTYDTLSIVPPFTAQKYSMAIDDAVKNKYDILIIDSLTHVWAGEGGLLAQKEALDSRGGNSFTNWASITKLHEQLKGKILQSDITVIATMRSKQEYIMEQNDKGKTSPRKVGLAPIQRDGLEYDFSVVFDIAMDHQYVASKDRTGLFDGVVEVMSEKTGEKLNGWLSNADRSIHVPSLPEPLKNENPAQSQRVTSSRPQPGTHTVVNHATGEPVKIYAPPSGGGETRHFNDHGEEYFHPGEYVVQLESKSMRGKKLKDIDFSTINKTIDWLLSNTKSLQNPSNKEFMQYANDYLVMKKKELDTSAPPAFDASEPIPDFGEPGPGDFTPTGP